MSILTKITIKQMLQNKRRSLVTIIGVIISVAMITAVSSFGGTFISYFQRMVIAGSGDFQMACLDISGTDVRTVLQQDYVKQHFTIYSEGFAKGDTSFGSRPFLYVMAINPAGFEPAQLTLSEGRYPANDSEVILSDQFAKQLSENYQIGEQISLDLGARYNNTYESYLAATDVYEKDAEEFQYRETKQYTIVGFANMTVVEASYSPAFTAVTCLDESSLTEKDTVQLYLTVDHLDSSIYDKGIALQDSLSKGTVGFNDELLFYNGMNQNFSFMLTVYGVAAVLIVIIIIGSISLIYNAFAISVTDRSSDFGMLASVGATKAQKRSMVLTEAGLIGIIAIPLGIFFGFLGIGITFICVSPLLGSSLSLTVPLRLKIMPSAIVAAILLSSVTILLSAWLPARRAAKITPIDAIRQTMDVKLTSKAVRTSRLTRNLFGLEGELALKNMKRNRLRYRTTLFSLVVSLCLFLSASAFTYYLSNAFLMSNESIDCDLDIKGFYNGDLQELLTVSEEINNLDVVDSAVIVSPVYNQYDLDKSLFSQDTLDYFAAAAGDQGLDSEEKTVNLQLCLMAVDRQTLERYCQATGVDFAEMQDSAQLPVIVVNDYVLKENKNFQDISIFKLQPGETLPYSTWLYQETTVLDEQGLPTTGSERVLNQEYDLNVVALTGERFTGIPEINAPNTVYLVTSFEVLQTMDKTADNHQIELFISSTSLTQAEEAIHVITDEHAAMYHSNWYFYNITDQKNKSDHMLLAINIFIYGFVTLISAIGVANMFNTISTSLTLRKREFAMLQSVGMTPHSFNRMISFESLLYGLKTLLYGLPLGFAVMYVIYAILGRNFSTSFTVPWNSVIGGVIGVLLVIASTMAWSSRHIKQESIVEALRRQ